MTHDSPGRSVRVLVVDDHPGIHYLLCASSARDPQIAVVAEAADAEEAIARPQNTSPT